MLIGVAMLAAGSMMSRSVDVPPSDPSIYFSDYNWIHIGTNPNPTANSCDDGTHPLAHRHAHLGAMVAAEVAAQLAKIPPRGAMKSDDNGGGKGGARTTPPLGFNTWNRFGCKGISGQVLMDTALGLDKLVLTEVGETAPPLKSDDDASNLLLNPNFEAVEEGTSNTPANWSVGTVFSRSLETHLPGATASLMYTNENPAVYQMATQSVPAVLLRGGCYYTLSATIKAHGLNTSTVGGGATLAAQWNAPPFYGDYLGSGPSGFSNWTTQSMTFVYPVSAPPMTVAAYVRPLVPGTNKTPVGNAFWGNFSLRADPPPRMKSFVLSPVYRGRITATAPAPIVVEVRLHFEEAATISVQAVLTRNGHSGVVVEKQMSGPYTFPATGPPGARTVALEFRVSPLTLEIGEYTVTVTCTGTATAGDVCGSPQRHNFTRVNDHVPNPAVYIDQLRRTIVGGKPFFPVGWFFGAGEEMTKENHRFELLARSPFNTVMPYGESSTVNLDAAHTLGMKVVSSLKQVYFGLPAVDGKAPAPITSIAAEAPYLRKRIAAAKGHPALLAWYTNDELSQSFLPQIRTHYEVFRESDPDHPTWQVLCEAGHFSDYLGSFDIIGSDPYPIGRPNQGAWGVREEINDTVVETAAARPVWATLQAINWKLYDPAMCSGQCHTPNASEVRSMTWQSIALGANGLFFWEFNDLYRNPDVSFNESFAYFSAVAEEVLRFSSVLLSENGPAFVPGASTPSNASHPGWLLLRAQRWPSVAGSVGNNNSLFLMAVSDGSGGGRVSFDFAAACHAGNVLWVTPLMPRTGALRRVDGCQFDDDIAPLDAHAYNITISSSLGMSIKTDDTERVQVKTDDPDEKPPPPNSLALSHMPSITGSDFPDFRAVFNNGECDASDPGYPKTAGINLNKSCFSCFRIPALLRNRQTGTLHAFAEARRRQQWAAHWYKEGITGCPDAPDTRLAYKRSTDSGFSWSNLTILANVPGVSSSQPTPVLDNLTNTLHVAFNSVGNDTQRLIVRSTECPLVNPSRLHAPMDGAAREDAPRLTLG